MERGDKVQITIEDISTEGQGIGKADGLAVFVREAVIGDFVLAELTKVKKKLCFWPCSRIYEAFFVETGGSLPL